MKPGIPKKPPKERDLSFFKQKLQAHPVALLIGAKLSPSRTYLRESPLVSARLEDSETYCRSEKHPIVKKINEQAHLFQETSLCNGEQAYVGNYGNLFQMLGDKFEPKDVHLPTSPGDAMLYHAILNYKNSLCAYIAAGVKKGTLITVGFYNQYPCIMIKIDEAVQSIFKKQTKASSLAAREEFSNFLMSYIVGLLNYLAFNAKLPVEIERRSSFGFCVPSVAATGVSIRMSVGIIPKVYADQIIVCLNHLNELLQYFLDNVSSIPAVPKGTFYGTAEHKKYLGPKYPPSALDNVFQLLLTQVEKAGKTTVQNMMRTAFLRDGISSIVFKELKAGKTSAAAFFAATEWAVKNIQIQKSKLTVIQKGDITYEEKLSCTSVPMEDLDFWNLIKLIVERARKLENELSTSTLDELDRCCELKVLDKLYYHLECLNEFNFVKAIETAKEENGDGYGSDSDTEATFDDTHLYARKIITHNGMRAIWSAIITATRHLSEQGMKCRLFLDQTYYEVPLGLKLIQRIHETSTIQEVKIISEASILLYDLNACATTATTNPDCSFIDDTKVLILDATSATEERVQFHVNKFISSRASVLFVVDSGFKNQQLGADKNQYGTVRIFTRDKKLLENLYESIKTTEPPLLSAISHRMRRMYKMFGTVPKTEKLIPKPTIPDRFSLVK